MGLKRKFDGDADAEYSAAKQLKLDLVPFPNFDNDVAMSDAPYEEPHHVRLSSSASSTSSSEYSPSPLSSVPQYPEFNLYPFAFFDQSTQLGTQDIDEFGRPRYTHPSPTLDSVSLLQPTQASPFTHHGRTCTQIPKLRVACSPGVNGTRTMWSHCEECGAIEMVAI